MLLAWALIGLLGLFLVLGGRNMAKESWQLAFYGTSEALSPRGDDGAGWTRRAQWPKPCALTPITVMHVHVQAPIRTCTSLPSLPPLSPPPLSPPPPPPFSLSSNPNRTRTHAANGRRFRWKGWEGHVTHRAETGPQLFDMTYKGRRIAYELSHQDMYVAYSGYGGAWRRAVR